MLSTPSGLSLGGSVSRQLEEELSGDDEGVGLGVGGNGCEAGIDGEIWIELHFDQRARSLAQTGEVVSSSPVGSSLVRF